MAKNSAQSGKNKKREFVGSWNKKIQGYERPKTGLIWQQGTRLTHRGTETRGCDWCGLLSLHHLPWIPSRAKTHWCLHTLREYQRKCLLVLRSAIRKLGSVFGKNWIGDSAFSTGNFMNSRYRYGTPLQYSCLKYPMDGGAWYATLLGVARSWTRLSDFTFTFHFHALEKEMAAHSSILAWRIPGMGALVGCHLWGHRELYTTDVT